MTTESHSQPGQGLTLGYSMVRPQQSCQPIIKCQNSNKVLTFLNVSVYEIRGSGPTPVFMRLALKYFLSKITNGGGWDRSRGLF